jgi:hypothetical protein
MLISDIVTELITETGGDTSDTSLATLFLGFLKSTLRRLPRHTRTRYLYATKTSTLSSGSYYVSLPTGFIRERDVYYIDSGSRVDIPQLSFDEFNEQFNSTSTGGPQGYRIVGNTVEFLRTADKDYTIYFECTQEIDNISVSDTVTWDSSVTEIVKDGAKYYYFDYEEDSPRATEKLTLFTAGLQKLETDFMSDEIPNYIEEA